MKDLELLGTQLMYVGLAFFFLAIVGASSDKYLGTAFKVPQNYEVGQTK